MSRTKISLFVQMLGLIDRSKFSSVVRKHDTDKYSKVQIKELGVIQIGLFGSYAKGEQNRTSDIDLLVTLDQKWSDLII